MFVRRMIAHFRGQTWTPKEFTAVGVDLVIVVLGVFIVSRRKSPTGARERRTHGAAKPMYSGSSRMSKEISPADATALPITKQ